MFPPLNIIFNRIFPFHMEDLKNLIPNCQKILTRTIPVLSKRNRKYCFDLPRIGIENHHAVGEIDRLLGNCKVLVADPVKRSFECCRILSQILLCHPKRFFFVELFSRRKIAVQQFLKRCGIFFDHIGPEIRPQQRESSQSSSERASTVPKPCVTAMSSSVRPAFASSISSDAPSIFPACSASVRSDQELRLSIPFVIVFCYHGCKCKTGERPLFCLAVLRFCRFTE